MTTRYAHILSFALEHPWNLTPDMLSVVAGILARHIAGVDSSTEIAAALVNRKNLPQPRAGSVAIIPVYGMIAPRMNLLSEVSGGTTYQKLTGQLRAAVNDKAIRNIVLDVDSPGGSVAGNSEFAQEVMRARAKKPIIAVAQYTMGSAAYHLSAGATEIVAAPSAQVGGIGTYTIHNDLSEALKNLGVKRTFISAGEGKGDGNDAGSPSEAFLTRANALVNQAFDQFVSNVVKGRGQGMTVDRVTKDWKAFVYSAKEAQANGMIDRVGTLDETVTRLLTESPDAGDQRAALTFVSTEPSTDEPPQDDPAPDRRSELQWQNTIERELQELDL